MDAWRQALHTDDAPARITYLADPTAAVSQACEPPRYCCHLGCILLKMAAMSLLTGGLDWDLAQFSAGQRSKRFSLLAVDGEVKAFNLMETPENATSDAATLLAQAQAHA
eukprot:COSAG04_NODE_2298_length_4363_cov_6.625820_2_plen_110_part_00